MAALSRLCKLARPILLGYSCRALSAVQTGGSRWASTADFQPPPTRPLQPYVMFAKVNLTESYRRNPNISNRDVMCQVATMWSDLSETEKERYKELYAVQVKEWGMEWQVFLSSLPDKEKYLKQLTALRRERRKTLKAFREKKQRRESRPPRKLSTYNIYMRDQMAGAAKEEITNIFREGAKNWKTMPEEKKAEYELEAKQIYEHEMAEFEKNKPQQQSLQSSNNTPEFHS